MFNNVYIVSAHRSAMTKAHKGGFAKTRPDELLADVIKQSVEKGLINPQDIDDVIVGCAFPEASQGMNVARISSLLAGLPSSIPGMTINRFCKSGLSAVALGAQAIESGQSNVIITAGVESMSLIPMGGNNMSISPNIFNSDTNLGIAYGMGLTAENVAKKWQISRNDQDEFAVLSHQKATNAVKTDLFKNQILNVKVTHHLADVALKQIIDKNMNIMLDDGIRSDTTLSALSKLPTPFHVHGCVTAGNSSQMTDGASVLILVSGEYLKQHHLKPMGKLLSFAVVGVPPEIMGIGPIHAIPKALHMASLRLKDISWIELNEAFAAQTLAVIRELKLDMNIVNPQGGAIAMGHPLGATGAILTTKLLHGMAHTQSGKYGIVSMCVGTGMGAAGVFEIL